MGEEYARVWGVGLFGLRVQCRYLNHSFFGVFWGIVYYNYDDKDPRQQKSVWKSIWPLLFKGVVKV